MPVEPVPAPAPVDELASRYADRPPWRPGPRLTAAAALAAGVAIGAAGQAWWGQERLDARLRSEVSLQASADAVALSTAPGGGRVDYYLRLHNTGPLPVRVDDVRVNGPRMLGRPTVAGPRTVTPQDPASIQLDLRADCGVASASRFAPEVHVHVDVTPADGRPRELELPVRHATIYSAMVAGVCSFAQVTVAEWAGTWSSRR